MAKSLKIGVCDLISELFAHAFVFFYTGQTAGAISTRALQPVTDGLNDLLIGVECNSHLARVSFVVKQQRHGPLFVVKNTLQSGMGIVL